MATNRKKSVYCAAVQSYEDTTNLQAAAEKLLVKCNIKKKLNENTNVLIKPNILSKRIPEDAVTTHPAAVRAVINALVKFGALPQNITVADSPGGVYNTAVIKSIYKLTGMTQLCDAMGVNLYTECRHVKKDADGTFLHSVDVIKPLESADVIINMCKLKTHVMTGLTCATKNLFGVIPGLQKAELHTRFPNKKNFGHMLVDVCEFVKADVHIVDAITAHEGDGPSGGAPRHVGLIFGGKSAYSVDLIAAHIIGINASTVPYLAAAHARNLCNLDENPLDLLYDDSLTPERISNFKLPKSYGSVNFADRVPKPFKRITDGFLKMLKPRPKVIKRKCIGCAKCQEICAANTIVMDENTKKARIINKNCISCFCCHEMCPVKAIDVKTSTLFKL